MIFSITYRDLVADATTPAKEHTTTFEASDRNTALAIIVNWMNHVAELGGIIQVVNIEEEERQEQPMNE